MRKLATTLFVVALLTAATQAGAAGRLGLGTGLGLTIHHPLEGGDNTTLLGFPGSASTLQPGFRIGYLTAGETHEVYLDTGMEVFSSGGHSQRFTTTMLNYQFNFMHESTTRPYVTAGFGLYNEHAEGKGMTSGLGGAGVGVRQWVSEDHGSLRLEFRYDRLGQSKALNDAFTSMFIPRANLFSVKAGFDLWVK